jgi:hypothetical protein
LKISVLVKNVIEAISNILDIDFSVFKKLNSVRKCSRVLYKHFLIFPVIVFLSSKKKLMLDTCIWKAELPWR